LSCMSTLIESLLSFECASLAAKREAHSKLNKLSMRVDIQDNEGDWGCKYISVSPDKIFVYNYHHINWMKESNEDALLVIDKSELHRSCPVGRESAQVVELQLTDGDRIRFRFDLRDDLNNFQAKVHEMCNSSRQQVAQQLAKSGEEAKKSKKSLMGFMSASKKNVQASAEKLMSNQQRAALIGEKKANARRDLAREALLSNEECHLWVDFLDQEGDWCAKYLVIKGDRICFFDQQVVAGYGDQDSDSDSFLEVIHTDVAKVRRGRGITDQLALDLTVYIELKDSTELILRPDHHSERDALIVAATPEFTLGA